MNKSKVWQALTVVLLVSGVTPVALAEPVNDSTRNAARTLASQGKDAFDAKDYPRAADLFQRAYALVPAPTIALYEAQSLAKLGRLVQAEEAYRRALRTALGEHSSEQFRDAVKEADSDLAALQPRIPKVTIVVTGPGASSPDLQVQLDGNVVNVAVVGVEVSIDPGSHVLTAVTPGGERSQVAFIISEKEHRRVEIEALPAKAAAQTTPAGSPAPKPAFEHQREPTQPAHPRRWQKPTAFAAGGLGVAGLATGVVTGLMASSKHETAEQQCPDHTCTAGSSGADALSSFRTLRTVSTIGYVVGGLGLAAGTTLLLTAPANPSLQARRVQLWLGPGSAGVRGAF